MVAKKLREPPVSADAADLALGVRLRQIRESRRISRRVVATGLGVSPQQIEKYETGLTRLSIGRLLRFAAVLDIAPAALLTHLQPESGEGSLGPDDPVFADACAAFGHLARIHDPALRHAMLDVLAVLAAQGGQPPRSSTTSGVEALAAMIPERRAPARAPVATAPASRQKGTATNLFNLPGHRRYREPEPEDTIS
nr:helix-turn-helix transcriptional regulator [uncultured Roseococcus sp.]